MAIRLNALVRKGTLAMTAPACPFCGLLVERKSTPWLICPQCYRAFSLTRSTDWTVLIVPFLAVQYFVSFVF